MTRKTIDERISSPRGAIISLAVQNNASELLVQAAQIHGHFCPGLSMGVLASMLAIRELGTAPLTAVVAKRSCWVDGIQFVAGCTDVNHGLTFDDGDATTVTFSSKISDRSVKITVLEEYSKRVNRLVPGFTEMRGKMGSKQGQSAEFLSEFRKKAVEGAFAILEEPLDELFTVEQL